MKTAERRKVEKPTIRDEDRQLIKVLIVSDNPNMRAGLRRILGSQTGIHVLGDVSIEGAGTVETTLRQHPDLVLIDLDPRGSDALGFIGTIQKTFKNPAVLVLSDLAGHELCRKALAIGAAGVVLKVQPPAILIAAIQDLCPRYSYASMPRSLATEARHIRSQKVPKTYVADTDITIKIDSLTTREREIIGLIGLGLKNKDIANRLSISDITVRHHLTSIYCKLEVADRQKLLILAHHYGLAELTSCAESMLAPLRGGS